MTVRKKTLKNIFSPNKPNQNQKQTMSETLEKKRYIVENHLSFSDESGGFAFPCSNDKIFTTADGEEITWSGMTLRDYFAAKAISLPDADYIKRNFVHRHQHAQWIAAYAYAVADAMIVERKN